MKSSQSLVSQRFCTFASGNNTEKHLGMMKPQGQPDTMIIRAATPSRCTTSIPMVVDLWKTRRIILDHPHKKEVRRPSIIGQISTISEAACPSGATVATEANTHSSLRTECTMVVKPTTTQKIALFSSSLKERWSKTPSNSRNNHRPGK
jgi:hypothetical protein